MKLSEKLEQLMVSNNLICGFELIEECQKLEAMTQWQPIETAPKDGAYVLLAGNSGYIKTPLRVHVCRYDHEYSALSPWVTHSNDCFTDDGGDPLYWMPLPNPPQAD